MDFSIVTSKRPQKPAQNACKLSFYQEAPHAEVTLENFEIFAMDRLRGEQLTSWAALTASNAQAPEFDCKLRVLAVLKGIEDAKSRGKRVDELDTVVHHRTRDRDSLLVRFVVVSSLKSPGARRMAGAESVEEEHANEYIQP